MCKKKLNRSLLLDFIVINRFIYFRKAYNKGFPTKHPSKLNSCSLSKGMFLTIPMLKYGHFWNISTKNSLN